MCASRLIRHVPLPQINDVKALWLEDSSAVTDEAHSALFKHLAGTWEDPHYTLMYKADAPIDIKSVFYIPRRNNETFGQPNAREIGVHLYSRRVLIQKHAKDLLPEYLRFVRGVVDSEDLPLSISRETMQDKKLLNKLKQVLTKRVIRWLIDEAKKNPEKYKSFYESFVMYLKEGVATDQANSKDILKLLRYPSSAQGDSTLISFQEYADRLQPHPSAPAPSPISSFSQDPCDGPRKSSQRDLPVKVHAGPSQLHAPSPPTSLGDARS